MIRNIGISVLDILELISQGYDYKSIIKKHPRLSLEDIRRAAQITHDYILKKMIYDKMRESDKKINKFKTDMLPINKHEDISTIWNIDNEMELKRLYSNDANITEIARIFKCSEDIVRLKIKKIGLIKGEKNYGEHNDS